MPVPPLLVRFAALGFAVGCLAVMASHMFRGPGLIPSSISAASSIAERPRDVTDVLFFGDSLTFGLSPPNGPFPYRTYVELILRPLLPAVNFHHVGYSGIRAAQLLSKADDEGGLNSLLRTFPAPQTVIMVLLIGTNDLGAAFRSTGEPNINVTVASIASDVIALHDLAAEKGIATLGIGIPPSLFTTERSAIAESIRIGINAVLSQHCTASASSSKSSSEPKSNCLDFLPSEKYDESEYCEDGLHFNEQGYKKLGGRVADLLKKQIGH